MIVLPSRAEFTWVDAERTIRFGPRALTDAPALLADHGFAGYALLSTSRSRDQAPALVGPAAVVIDVPTGGVPDAAASVRGATGARPLVALGGGRVIDVAKAIGGADGNRVAASPTTLSGAEMSGIHRLPAGAVGSRLVRPSLVIVAPDVAASQPLARLTASAMNALAHAVEALYAPGANPLCDLAALRAIRLIASGLDRAIATGADPATGPGPPSAAGDHRGDLALGSVLAGYALGVTGYSLHHALCQTIVRVAGTPHAETNAVILPHVVRLVAQRDPGLGAQIASASAPGDEDPATRVDRLCAAAGVPRTLTDLGAAADRFDPIVEQALSRREAAWIPGGIDRPTLAALLGAAWDGSVA